MNIVCERCNTVYRFDAARLPPGGKKVQCSQCNHVFVVKPPTPPVAGAPVSVTSGVIQLDSSQRRAEPLNPTGPAPSASQERRLILRQDGTRYSVKDMNTLQRWIMERRITRDAEFSEDGVNWTRVGDRTELTTSFAAVERAQRRPSLNATSDAVAVETRSEGVRIATAFQRGQQPDVEDEEEEEDELLDGSSPGDDVVETDEGETDNFALPIGGSRRGDSASQVATADRTPTPPLGTRPVAAAPLPVRVESRPNKIGYVLVGVIAVLLMVLLIRKLIPGDDSVPAPDAVASLPPGPVGPPLNPPPGNPVAGVPSATVNPNPVVQPPAPTPAPVAVAPAVQVPTPAPSTPAPAPRVVPPRSAEVVTPPTAVASKTTPPSESPGTTTATKPATPTASVAPAAAGPGKEELSIREARSSYKRGDYDKAAAKFREAIEANPRKATYHEELGWTYMELSDRSMKSSDLDKAEESFSKALALDPARSGAHFGLGRIYQRLGKTNDAIRSYERCIQYNPSGGDTQEAKWFLTQLKNDQQ